MILDIGRLLLFPSLMAFAAASDLLTMTISNRVSLLLIAGFAVLAAGSGMGLHDILMHLGAAAVVFAAAFFCFAMGWIGGGDAKVATATALWLGFAHLLDYLVYASLFGGVLSISHLFSVTPSEAEGPLFGYMKGPSTSRYALRSG